MNAEHRNKLASDPELVGKLAKVLVRHPITITRWCEQNSPHLTADTVLNTLTEYWNTTRDQILDQATA